MTPPKTGTTPLTEPNIVVHGAGPIRSGDTLVIGFTNTVPPTEARRIRERFGELLPGVTVVVLDHVAQLAVYRPGAE